MSSAPGQGSLFAFAQSEGVEPVATEKPKAKAKRHLPMLAGSAPLAFVPPTVPLPKTLGDCRQAPVWDEETQQWLGGACPKWFCENHVIGRVLQEVDPETGRVTTETIVVGARGGSGKGISLAAKRSERGRVKLSDLDALVDVGIAISDSLPSDCAEDYIANPDLIDGADETDSDEDGRCGGGKRPHMTLEQIARVYQMTREGARMMELKALMKARSTEEAQELAPAYDPEPDVPRRLREWLERKMAEPINGHVPYTGPVIRRRGSR